MNVLFAHFLNRFVQIFAKNTKTKSTECRNRDNTKIFCSIFFKANMAK